MVSPACTVLMLKMVVLSVQTLRIGREIVELSERPDWVAEDKNEKPYNPIPRRHISKWYSGNRSMPAVLHICLIIG